MELQYRAQPTQSEQIDDNTIELSVSSETPYDRYGRKEILSHTEESILSHRLIDAPFLVNHDTSDHVGVIKSYAISDGKLRVRVQFSTSARAQEIKKDIIDGVRRNTSIGYYVHEKEEIDDSTYRVTLWEPLEASSVSIPADPTVGYERKIQKEKEATMPEMKETPIEKQAEVIEELRTITDGIKSLESSIIKIVSEQKSAPLPEPIGKIGMAEGDVQKYSLLRAINAVVENNWSGAKYEREITEATRESYEKSGIAMRGNLQVPYDIQTRAVDSATYGTHMAPNVHLGSSFIEYLYNAMVLPQLGVTTLSGNLGTGTLTVPKQSGTATGYWVSEAGTVTDSSQSYTSLTLTPKTVGAMTTITRKAIQTFNPQIEALTMNDISKVLAGTIETAFFHGTNANNQPKGLVLQDGIGTVVGTTLDWEKVVEFESDVLTANVVSTNLKYVTNASVAGTLKTREKATGYPVYLIENGQMNGYGVLITNSIAANHIIFGDFSQSLMADWGTLDLLIDPYTYASSGSVRMVMFRSVDFAVRHAGAFSFTSNFS